jgi:hypothetical protein
LKKLAVAAVLVLVVGAGVFAWHSQGRSDAGSREGAAPAPAPSAASVPAASPTPPVAGSEAAQTGPGRRTTSFTRQTTLMQEFTAARDFKPLYDRLMAAATPTPEELYVLAQILDRCAKVTERVEGRGPQVSLGAEEARRRFEASLPEKDPDRARRVAAFVEVNRDPCTGMEAIEVSEKDIRSLLERAAAGGDPKARALLITRDLLESMKGPDGRARFDPSRFPSMSDAQIETLKQVGASLDPDATMNALRAFTMPLRNLSIRTGEDGAPINHEALRAAMTLVACELGYPCGPHSRQMLEICTLGGACDAPDYHSYVFSPAQPAGDPQLIEEYYRQLRRATREGDWSYFTFHRGPSGLFSR